jgi:hypothetical protein
MTATLNGKDLLSATITEPRTGVWTAVVDVDADEAITGTVTIVIDTVTWIGTVAKGSLNAGRFHAQVVGGAGKLATVLPAKYYLGAPISVVLQDLMLGTGETLSDVVDDIVRTYTVARWARPLGKASAAIKQCAEEMGLVWRVQREGQIWLGAEKWIDTKPEYDEIDRSPGRDSMLIAPTAPTLQPGVRFLGRNVSRVTTMTKGGGGLRQEVLFEVAAGGGRVAEDIGAIIGHHTENKFDYSRMYPAKVLKQAGDGTLELLPDAERIRGNGLTRVPIRHGIPGVTVKVPAGGKVLLFFESGDPKLPAACLWPDGSSCTEVKIVAPKLIVEGNIECTGEIVAKSTTAPVALSSHLHPSAVGPTGIPTPGAPLIS